MAIFAAIRRALSAVTPVTYLRCGSNYPAPSSRNGELNAEGNSHAQDQHLRRCCCIVPDWRWSMDWRRNTDFDQCACWFEHRSILDDGECKEPRTTSIEPPVAKQALKSPGRCAWGSIFRSISSGSFAIFPAILLASSFVSNFVADRRNVFPRSATICYLCCSAFVL